MGSAFWLDVIWYVTALSRSGRLPVVKVWPFALPAPVLFSAHHLSDPVTVP